MSELQAAREAIEALGRAEGQRLPAHLLVALRDTQELIRDEEQERAERDAAALRAVHQGPRVPLAVEGGTVVAKTPAAEPAARTLRSVLDLIAQKPLGSMAQAVLEIAAHVELLELENERLRARLDEIEDSAPAREV